MAEITRAYAIQCSNCLRYLGISETEQEQHIFCTECGKQKLKEDSQKD